MGKIDYDKDLLNYYIDLFKGKFPTVNQLSTHDYGDMLKRHTPILLDARSEEEYRFSWMIGAIWCPASVTDDKLKDFLSKRKGHNVVCHCGAGGRGNALAMRVQKLDVPGIKKVYNLEGGVFKWVNEGKPVVGPKKEVYAASALRRGVFERVTIGRRKKVYVDSVTAAKMVKPDVVFIPKIVWSML